MTKEIYESLDAKEKAFFDCLMVLIKTQGRTNDLLELILKGEPT